MDNSMGLHKIEPVDGRAVSLHVIYPPIDVFSRYNMSG